MVKISQAGFFPITKCFLSCFLCRLGSYFSRAFSFFFFFFICSEFCHTLEWNSHGFTCVPHPDHPYHLPLHPLPLGFPSAPGPSACLIHPTWAGDLFHPRYYTCFDAVLVELSHLHIHKAWWKYAYSITNWITTNQVFESLFLYNVDIGLPRWLSGKESTASAGDNRRHEFNLWVRKVPWRRRKWQPIPGFLPGKSRQWRSLEDYSSWGHRRVAFVTKLLRT